MHHIIGVRGIVAGETPEQRDKANALGIEPRQLLDRRSQRAPMAEADDLVRAAIDLPPEIGCAGETERAKRQSSLAEVRRHLAGAEPARVSTNTGFRFRQPRPGDIERLALLVHLGAVVEDDQPLGRVAGEHEFDASPRS